jgi:hypothetical protein
MFQASTMVRLDADVRSQRLRTLLVLATLGTSRRREGRCIRSKNHTGLVERSKRRRLFTPPSALSGAAFQAKHQH